MKKILCFALLLIYMPLAARVYFIHIPKTAGTTLRFLLEMQVSPEEVYPHRNKRTAKEPIHHNLVAGHLPYWLCQKLDPDFEMAFKITVLRDPIERYLSFLRAKKARHQHPDLESVMELRFSENNPYKMGMIDNAMCRFLATSQELEGEALLQSAIENLNKIDCVIFFDSFDRDVVELFQRFGVTLDEKEVPKMNTTQKEPVNQALLDQIREENLWDLKLYEYAKDKLT